MICRFATLLSREQATEDPLAEFERLNHSGSSALSGGMSVSPRSQMFFRPEEVDRRSERLEGLAPLVTALAEPDHHALGVQPRPVRRCGEFQRFVAVMAGRRNVHGFCDHRRDAERVGRATSVPLASGRESYSKRRWRSRERVGDVDLTGADTDHVLIIECREGIVDRLRTTVRRARDDVLDRDRPASLEEGPQDEPDKRLLASRPASGLPFKGIEGLQLVRRHDHEVRNDRPLFHLRRG